MDDDGLTATERREASRIMGEIAANRLHVLLEERMAELGAAFTQADLARQIGATEQQVSQWLNAPRNMTVKSAGRLVAGMRALLAFDLDRAESMGAGNTPPAAGYIRIEPRPVPGPLPGNAVTVGTDVIVALPTRETAVVDT